MLFQPSSVERGHSDWTSSTSRTSMRRSACTSTSASFSNSPPRSVTLPTRRRQRFSSSSVPALAQLGEQRPSSAECPSPIPTRAPSDGAALGTLWNTPFSASQSQLSGNLGSETYEALPSGADELEVPPSLRSSTSYGTTSPITARYLDATAIGLYASRIAAT